MPFRLTILGSSSAIPVFDRMPTAQVLQAGESLSLIDCGEGTQVQLRKFKIRMQRIQNIFISHLHGDHFFGLVGLISTLNLLGRTKRLTVYADPRLEAIVMEQLAVTETELHFPLQFIPLPEGFAGLIHEDKRITVEAFPVNHRIPTFGFLFRETPRLKNVISERLSGLEVPVEAWARIRAGEDFVDASGRVFRNADITMPAPEPKSYAFVSDTLYDPSITRYVEGVDLLYHEATFLHEMAEIAREKFHSTAREAALFAQQARVKQLLIGHFSARYRDIQPLLAEALSVFPATLAGTEGTVIDINRIV